MTHLLVTNDFPPKVGGIQAYLWELWRRLEPATFAVLTARSHPDASAFDRQQGAHGIRIERVPGRVLAPTPSLVRRIRDSARRIGADLVLIDPAFPLGVVGPQLGLPYGVILHGAEVAVPGRLPLTRRIVARVLRHSTVVVSAGGYPAAEAAGALRRATLPTVVEVPPGVDLRRFRPLTAGERAGARVDLGLPVEGPLVVSVSRLVPRKGMDVLIDAAVRLHPDLPDLTVAIAGRGRDWDRLAGRVAEHSAPVRLLGGVSDVDLPRLVGAADVFAMLCRNRWLGLEQEGFGIVFLEAAAAGVPQVAGASGGAWEAVEHECTGLVVRRPTDVGAAARSIGRLLEDEELRSKMGAAARRRAEASFDYDRLAPRLASALADMGG
ncbi:MAG TPA: glycosyltransferase family 4 protein [Acidimicrobiales bacterium]|jgi:phosphatidylinositol alpha-1,6-mannosyltransferase|nr:glycosyltransferase family 4 protein [Acidimicrobiales bacterium]